MSAPRSSEPRVVALHTADEAGAGDERSEFSEGAAGEPADDTRLEFSEGADDEDGACTELGRQSRSTLYRLTAPKGPLVSAHIGRRRVWCRRSIRLYLIGQHDRCRDGSCRACNPEGPET